MPDNPSRLSQFWQELKRRKVIRVITVYAAAAFVILELVSIIVDPLKLPEWTLSLVIVLLCVGFIIAIILSWIYDINPEGSIVRTSSVIDTNKLELPVASSGWKMASYISFVVIVALIILNIIPRRGSTENNENLDKSIAVLPFQNLSEEEGNEHFVDGLVEDLLNKISVIEELKVISRTSSDMFRERGLKSVPEIAAELNVSYIVEGSVQRYGNKARITVQLIDGRNDHHLWAKNYDRDLVDVFRTQSEIAMKIASELNTILTSQQEALIQESWTKNVQAFEFYQMGRFYWHKRTGEGYRKSLEYFEKAIKADPNYGLAYAGLADSYNLMAIQGWIDILEGRNNAVELARQALELDENLAEAYTVLGSIYDYVDFEWEKAEKAFQRALEINPNYSTAHHYYAEHLAILGKHEQARKHIERAIELDPFQFVKRYVSAKLYMNHNQIQKALDAIDMANELHEDHPWVAWTRLQCYWKLNEYDKAFDAFRIYYDSNPLYEIEKADSIFTESGFQGVMEWKIEVDLQNKVPGHNDFALARWNAMAGHDDEALYWLEQARIHLEGAEMSIKIYYHHLHQDPRFLAILEKMGLISIRSMASRFLFLQGQNKKG